MHPTSVSETGVNLIKKFEGCHKQMDDGRIRSYRDPVGKWTIGYGHTKGVRSGQHITPKQAHDFLIEDLKVAADAVRRHVNVPLTQNQFDALVSFVFNLGEGNFASSTLLKKLNRGEYDEVPEQIVRWNKARIDGVLKPLRGLTRRRSAEAALFSMDAKLASEGGEYMPQKGVTNTKKDLSKSRTMAGAGIAGIGTILTGVSEQLQSLVSINEIFEYAFVAVTLIGIILVAYARYDDHKAGER